MKKAILFGMMLVCAQVSAAQASTANMDIEKDVIRDGTTVTPTIGNDVHTFDTIMFGTPIMLMKDQKLKLSLRFGTDSLFDGETLHSLKLDGGSKSSNKESLKMTIKGTDIKLISWKLSYKLRDKSIATYDKISELNQTPTEYVRDKDDLQLGEGEFNIGMLILEFTNKDAAKLSISSIDIALDAKSITKDSTLPIYVPVPAPGLLLASAIGMGWVARRLGRANAKAA